MTAQTPSQPSFEPPSTKPVAPKTAKESFLARLLDPLDRLVEGIYSVLIVLDLHPGDPRRSKPVG